jgi:hypothetical protein
MGSYYAGAGPEDGILMYCDVAGSIDVFEDPACTAPAGTARCIGWDAAGSAVWRLAIQDADDDGPWVIVDREFMPTQPDCRDLYRADAHHGLGGGDRAARNRRRRPGILRPAAAAVQPSAT